jgi:hypothetical protein
MNIPLNIPAMPLLTHPNQARSRTLTARAISVPTLSHGTTPQGDGLQNTTSYLGSLGDTKNNMKPYFLI